MYKFAIFFISCFFAAKIHVQDTSEEDDFATDRLLKIIFDDYRRCILAASTLNHEEFLHFIGDDDKSIAVIVNYVDNSNNRGKNSSSEILSLDLINADDFNRYMRIIANAHGKDVATFARECFKKATCSDSENYDDLDPNDFYSITNIGKLVAIYVKFCLEEIFFLNTNKKIPDSPEMILEMIFNDYLKHVDSGNDYLNMHQFFKFLGDDKNIIYAIKDAIDDNNTIQVDEFILYVTIASQIQNNNVVDYATECFNKATRSETTKNEASKSVQGGPTEDRASTSVQGNPIPPLIKDKANSIVNIGMDIANYVRECFIQADSATSSGPDSPVSKLESIFHNYRKHVGTKKNYLDIQQFFEFLGEDHKSVLALMDYIGDMINRNNYYRITVDEFILCMTIATSSHSVDNDVVAFTNERFNKATRSKTTKNEASTPVHGGPTEDRAATSVQGSPIPSPIVDVGSYNAASTSAEDGLTTKQALKSIFNEYRKRLGTDSELIQKEDFFAKFLGDNGKYRKAVDEYLKKKRLELAVLPREDRKHGYLYLSSLDTMSSHQFRIYMKVASEVYNNETKDKKDVVTFAKECLENLTRPKTPTTEMGKI